MQIDVKTIIRVSNLYNLILKTSISLLHQYYQINKI